MNASFLEDGQNINDFIGAKQSHVKILWYKKGGHIEPIVFYLDDEDNLQRFIYAHSVGIVSSALRLPDRLIELATC